VACGSLVATGLGSDAGLTSLDQALHVLRAASPEVTSRISTRRASISTAAISTGERVA
jgi:hypothetical protein